MRCLGAKCLSSTWLASTAVSSASRRAKRGTFLSTSGLQAMDHLGSRILTMSALLALEFSSSLNVDMQVHFTAEVEKKLTDLAVQSGRRTDELVQDVMESYLDELEQARHMLDSRYDDLKSGRIKAIDGEEAFARLKARTEVQRKRRE